MNRPWPDAERPSPRSVARRREVLEAAAAGDHGPARAALTDGEWRVRATALATLGAAGELDHEDIQRLHTDPAPGVRRRLAEVAASEQTVDLGALLRDQDPGVVEVACWAAGEHGNSSAAFIDELDRIGRDHDDALCREAAVAALGAIGHPDGLATILHGTTDRATVRRRAILALAPFDGPEVSAALTRALDDRDWQVRQAAEDLLG